MACAGTRAASSSRTPGAVGGSGHTVPHDPRRTLSRAGAGMTDVLLRDVDDADLEVFYEQQREEEAVRRAQFPARDRDRFLTHWRTKVLGNPHRARPDRHGRRRGRRQHRRVVAGRQALRRLLVRAAVLGPRGRDRGAATVRAAGGGPPPLRRPVRGQHRLGAAPRALRLPAGGHRPRRRCRVRGAQARRGLTASVGGRHLGRQRR